MTLTVAQKIIFAGLLREHKDIIFAKFSEKITKKLKDQTWGNIYAQLLNHGVTVTLDHLRNNEWDALKRGARRRYDQQKKSGAAGSRLAEYDEIILDVIGRNEPHTDGLGTRDVRVAFGRERSHDSESQDELPDISFIPRPNETMSNVSMMSVRSADLMPPPSFASRTPRSSTPVLSTQSTQSVAETQETSTVTSRKGSKRKTEGGNLFVDDDFKNLKKDVLSLRKEKMSQQKVQRELRIEKTRLDLYEAQRESDRKNEMFQLEMDAKRAKIRRDVAMARFYERQNENEGSGQPPKAFQFIPGYEHTVFY